MRRSATTAPVVATFAGVHVGLHAWWHNRQANPQLQQPAAAPTLPHQLAEDGQPAAAAATLPFAAVEVHQPVLAGAAVRTALCETAAALHPFVHAQRAAAHGFAAAGIFALGGWLEVEQQRQQRAADAARRGAARREQQQDGWG